MMTSRRHHNEHEHSRAEPSQENFLIGWRVDKGRHQTDTRFENVITQECGDSNCVREELGHTRFLCRSMSQLQLSSENTSSLGRWLSSCVPPPSDCVQSDPAFSPILFGRSFDGTRDKWTAMGRRLAWAGCPLAASPLKCNMLFVTELWPKSSAIESIRPSRRASEEEGKDLQERTHSVRPPRVCVSGLARRMTTMQRRGDLKRKDGV